MSAKLERMLREEINIVLRPVGICPIFTLLYFGLWDFFFTGLYDRLCQKSDISRNIANGKPFLSRYKYILSTNSADLSRTIEHSNSVK